MHHRNQENKNTKKRKMQIKFVKFIYDPIYGYIGITEPELKIIDTSIFQRLRRIRQLGPVEYVYPTATHNRFSHSLGTMHVATKMFEKIWSDPQSVKICTNDEKDYTLQLLRLAALVHDLGHPPFSHALEYKGLDHEKLTMKIIESSEVGDIMNKYSFDKKKIIDILRGSRKFPALSRIISSPFDADRLDYLQRDAYFTGVRFGMPDIDRIIIVLSLVERDGELVWAIPKKGISAIETMLIGRYHMFQAVYYHKTVSGFEALLLSILKALIAEKYIWSPSEIVQKNDWELWAKYDDAHLINIMRKYLHDGKDNILKEKIKYFLERTPPYNFKEGRFRSYVAPGEESLWESDELAYAELVTFRNRMEEFDLDNDLKKWILFYEPKLNLIKEYTEKAEVLYIIESKDKIVSIREYRHFMLNRLFDMRYHLLRLYTKKSEKEKLENLFKRISHREVMETLNELKESRKQKSRENKKSS